MIWEGGFFFLSGLAIFFFVFVLFRFDASFGVWYGSFRCLLLRLIRTLPA